MAKNSLNRRSRLVLLCATVVGIIAVTVLILLAMGRAPWYQAGPVKLWTGDPSGPETSQQFTDPYTLTHITHGVLLYFLLRAVAGRLPLRRGAIVAVAAECGWEIFENTDMVIRRYREMTMALGYYGDSVVNSVGDILACTLGFALASRFPAWMTVTMTALIELGLMLWIRDSLLLNVLMLVCPIESVRNWQLGR